MSRIDVLLQHPKRTLGVLALVLVAVGVAVGSGANFSASSANPSNTFTAGTLTMSNSNDAAAILNASNWKPGDTTNGTVDIQNTGSLAGTSSVALGSYAANEKHRYQFAATFNSSAGNAYQGDNSSATFTWDAVQ